MIFGLLLICAQRNKRKVLKKKGEKIPSNCKSFEIFWHVSKKIRNITRITRGDYFKDYDSTGHIWMNQNIKCIQKHLYWQVYMVTGASIAHQQLIDENCVGCQFHCLLFRQTHLSINLCEIFTDWWAHQFYTWDHHMPITLRGKFITTVKKTLF